MLRATTFSRDRPGDNPGDEVPVQYSGSLLEIVEWATYHNLQWTEVVGAALYPWFFVERHDCEPLTTREREILSGCKLRAENPFAAGPKRWPLPAE